MTESWSLLAAFVIFRHLLLSFVGRLSWSSTSLYFAVLSYKKYVVVRLDTKTPFLGPAATTFITNTSNNHTKISLCHLRDKSWCETSMTKQHDTVQKWRLCYSLVMFVRWYYVMHISVYCIIVDFYSFNLINITSFGVFRRLSPSFGFWKDRQYCSECPMVYPFQNYPWKILSTFWVQMQMAVIWICVVSDHLP